MELKDEIALICVNAILQLKLGTVPDVNAAGTSSDGNRGRRTKRQASKSN